MPTNTNDQSIPPNTLPDELSVEDVDGFVHALSEWGRTLPRAQQALLHVVLAAGAAAESPDVGTYLAGFAIPNPRDVIVAATGSATGSQTGAVVGPASDAIAGDMSDGQAAGAAGGVLARAVLNSLGEREPQQPVAARGASTPSASGRAPSAPA